MRTLLGLIIATFLSYSLAEEESQRVTCNDIKNITIIGTMLVDWFSTDEMRIYTNFYISTNLKKEPVPITLRESSELIDIGFDVSKKTFIITHGYISDGQQPWCLSLKTALLESTGGNVIMVDWSDGSNKKNYVNAAKNTELATNHIFNFLQKLRARVRDLKGSSTEILWNHLHFIGHSLGAHVCGQTAYLLKPDPFWKVERITGLDPAKPCFSNVGPSLRIDRENADFVDVYHTQIGLGYTDALGLSDNLGHIDFYLNGGFEQPACQAEPLESKAMFCSHTLATKYFTEAINTTLTKNCTFLIQPWDGSLSDAQRRFDYLKSGMRCRKCPKMGMDAVKSKKRGAFLVLTNSSTPYCKINLKPISDIQTTIPGISKLIGIKSIFEHGPPKQ